MMAAIPIENARTLHRIRRLPVNNLKTVGWAFSVGVLLSDRWVAALIAAVFFALSFLVLYHQKVTFGLWFQVGDLHHETFAIAAVAVGIGVLIGSAITRCGKFI